MARPSERAKSEQPPDSGPVLFYNEMVVDHFMNPRNVGELAENETDGFGLVGDPLCGEEMKLWISVRSGKIGRIAFKSFGCLGATAHRRVYRLHSGRDRLHRESQLRIGGWGIRRAWTRAPRYLRVDWLCLFHGRSRPVQRALGHGAVAKGSSRVDTTFAR
jgi:hypothetical protein